MDFAESNAITAFTQYRKKKLFIPSGWSNDQYHRGDPRSGWWKLGKIVIVGIGKQKPRDEGCEHPRWGGLDHSSCTRFKAAHMYRDMRKYGAFRMYRVWVYIDLMCGKCIWFEVRKFV